MNIINFDLNYAIKIGVPKSQIMNLLAVLIQFKFNPWGLPSV